MTPNETEGLLRDALRAHRDDVDSLPPGTDPWLIVSRAHRRSRARHRTVTAGTLIALTAVGGGLASGVHFWPAHTTDPANNSQTTQDFTHLSKPEDWHALDDGKPRGALGQDSQLLQDVLNVLEQVNPITKPVTQPDSVHVLWADVLNGRRYALVAGKFTNTYGKNAKPEEQIVWLSEQTAGGPLLAFESSTDAKAILPIEYDDGHGGKRVRAVVPRGSTVIQSRTGINVEGYERAPLDPVSVHDGVVDVPLPDPLGAGPLNLQASFHKTIVWTSTLQLGTEARGQSTSPELTAAERLAATQGARGPGIPLTDKEQLGHDRTSAAINSVINKFESDAAHTSPRVEWAGTTPAALGSGILTAVSGGLPDQGRLLEIRRETLNGRGNWQYVKLLPAGKLPDAVVWRTESSASPEEAVVGWLFGPGVTSVEVTVNGKARSVTTTDGLGWLSVERHATVTVTAHGLPGGTVTRVVRPQDSVPSSPSQLNPLDFGVDLASVTS